MRVSLWETNCNRPAIRLCIFDKTDDRRRHRDRHGTLRSLAALRHLRFSHQSLCRAKLASAALTKFRSNEQYSSDGNTTHVRAMSSHLKGLIITTLGVLFVVPDSLFVRLIDAEPLVTAYWRGMISGLIILVAVPIFQGVVAFSASLRTGWPGLIYTLLIGTTAPAFVFAITYTSVANAVFILASTPVFAAIFSRIFLGEPIALRMALTMLAVLIGMAIIAYGSGSTGIASWRGDLWAVYVAMAFAAALTALRKIKETPMVAAIPVGYIGAALIVGLFVSPLSAFEMQWPLFLAHGTFIAAATCLLTLGPRYISSAEVSLLILLESVLAPILAWAVIGEDPGSWALAGGAVVIGALLVSNLFALRAHS